MVNGALRYFTLATILILLAPTTPLFVEINSSETASNTSQYHFAQIISEGQTKIPHQKANIIKPKSEQSYLLSRDADNNKIEDNLQARIQGLGSSIEDIRLIITYDRQPDENDIAKLLTLGSKGARIITGLSALTTSLPANQIDAAAQESAVKIIAGRGTIVWAGDIQTKAVKARPSDNYSQVAWDLGYQGRNITIALTDTGVDDEHPGLSGKFVAGMDATKLEGPVPVDPWIQQPTAPRDGTYNPDDEGAHGTACMGMASATGLPGNEYIGAAPQARLVDVRIGTRIGYGYGEPPDPQSFYDSALEGLDWILEHRQTQWESQPIEVAGVDIVSLSWSIQPDGNPPQGSDGSDEYSQLLDELVRNGVHVVNAASNDGPDNTGLNSMAASSLSIVVASLDDHNTVIRDDDTIASYSSRGPRTSDDDGNPYDELIPTIAAPGTNIIQAEANTNPGESAENNDYSGRGSGTSYATPSVAGIVALMLEANPDLDPLVTREILKATAERRGTPEYPELDPYWTREFGWGMVDAHSAVLVAENLKGRTDNIATDIQTHLDMVNVTGDILRATGQAWAQVGTMDKVEWRIEGGEWYEATYETQNTELAPGEAFNWSITLELDHLPTENQTVEVRGVRSGEVTITSLFTVKGIEAGSQKADVSLLLIYGFGAVQLILLVLVGWNLMNRRQEHGPKTYLTNENEENQFIHEDDKVTELQEEMVSLQGDDAVPDDVMDACLDDETEKTAAQKHWGL